jgi:hypothetical protein
MALQVGGISKIETIKSAQTQEEQHPTFNITLILYKLGFRSGV